MATWYQHVAAAVMVATSSLLLFSCSPTPIQSNYVNNRAPLVQKPYIQLPLGAIRANGWLEEMLIRQRDGATGQLDQLYPSVMGDRNGWLGGDGDQWERGPYWIDGLLPLAYLLDDQALKAKAQRWVEWTLNSQQSDGYFGPATDYKPEKGLQRDNAHDWWPKMVMLKILQQYYSATEDERVITLMTNYFKYQLKTLPEKPLGHWTFWAEYRVCDNLQAVHWLYNITGDSFLLELGELLHKQGYDFTHMFLNTTKMSELNSIHCVNLAQGLKEPIIYYQQNPDKQYIDAVMKGLADIKRFNGQPQGMYGGDEALHGNNPTQGSEFCSAVELMFSLEKMLEITGELSFADHLERIAFNALPTQHSDDFMTRQYFQQANQVMITRHARNFDCDHGQTDVLYGLLTGYPCCTSNMHQGWPKFTQNLFYATPDNGVAALVYAPSTVILKVANGVEVKITEETHYPFEEQIRFKVEFIGETASAQFPFRLRIPEWCEEASLSVNGAVVQTAKGSTVATENRIWNNGDLLTLDLPMKVRTSEWYEKSTAVERGPLVYALKMDEVWTQKEITEHNDLYGSSYYEVTSATPWNWGICRFKDADTAFVVSKRPTEPSRYPWNVESAPIEIRVKAREIPSWTLYNEMAGPQPYGDTYHQVKGPRNDAEITLIPYGCTTLRIVEFPLAGR